MRAQLIERTGLGLVLLLTATDVAAQTPKEVSAGFSYMNFEGETRSPPGGYLSFAEGGGPVRGVVDFTYQMGSTRMATFTGGVRVGPRARGGVTPFGQA